MNTTQATLSTQLKVGIFTILGLGVIGGVSLFVNDRPYWWRGCEAVYINVADATGLKQKSPIQSLGLQIGYLKSVQLSETHVRLGVCITAPVEVLPTTRGYIRSEGFLGDKFIELKPVRYTGPHVEEPTGDVPPAAPEPAITDKKQGHSAWPADRSWIGALLGILVNDAMAQEGSPAATSPVRGTKDIPAGDRSGDVQQVVEQVNTLVKEMTGFTTDLRKAIDPKELRQTMLQLNKTLENASRVLSPEGGLNTTAQRTLAKLEDAIEQLRDIITRVNRGEGSVGMVLNDPSYAEELREAIKNINRLLSRVGGYRFIVDLSVVELNGFDGSRGAFRLGIWPSTSRYYLLGISADPRGRRSLRRTTTTSGGLSTTVETETVEETSLVLTAMLGKVFYDRLDLSAGALNGDGTASAKVYLGPKERENKLLVGVDIYSRGRGQGIQERVYARYNFFSTLYAIGGLETLKKVSGKTAYFYGAGLSFDDEDIKLLFTLL